jgi:hypothetical protein
MIQKTNGKGFHILRITRKRRVLTASINSGAQSSETGEAGEQKELYHSEGMKNLSASDMNPNQQVHGQ